MPVYHLDAVQIGDALFEGVRAPSRDYNRALAGRGIPRIDGIFGYHLFSGYVLTLDYPGRRVRIEEGPLEVPEGARTLALTGEPGGLPTIQVVLDGAELGAYFDSGSMGGIHVPAAAVEDATFLEEPYEFARARTVTGEFPIQKGRIDAALSIGGVERVDPWLELSEVMPTAVIGSAFLRDYVLSIDAEQAIAWLRSPKREATLAGETVRRPGRTELAGRVEVPLVFESGRPGLDVWIDGSGPHRMIFDTGAGTTMLDDDLVAELALESSGSSRLGDPAAPESLEVSDHDVALLQIDDALFHDVTVAAMDLGPMLGDGVRGIVGWPTFQDCLVTIDYAGQRLVLERGALPDPGDGSVLEYSPEADSGQRSFKVRAASLELDAHLDTGNPGAVTLPARTIGELPLSAEPVVVGRGRTVSGSFEISRAELEGNLTLGAFALESPALLFQDRFDAANVGGELLRDALVRIDYPAGRIVFVPADSPSAAAPSRPRRYGLGLGFGDPRGLSVRVLEAGLPAAESELAVGDVITAVNGVPAGELDRAALGEAMRSSPVRLTVSRDGESFEVELSLD